LEFVHMSEKGLCDRPTWRERKPQNINRSAATAAEVELPPKGELRERALGTAMAIMEDSEVVARARVAAVKVLLEATAPKPREFVLQLLDGDTEAYERWLRAELAELESKRPVSLDGRRVEVG
jgi:hypothetical protein